MRDALCLKNNLPLFICPGSDLKVGQWDCVQAGAMSYSGLLL